MPNKKLKVASLFCGCGGSDLGMLGGFDYLGKRYKKLPFDIVYAIDFDKWAVETYNKNFRHNAICADVKDVDFINVPDVDVMIGGFPCQSFSTVNPTKNTNDARANLYKQIVRFLQTKHPKYFICENVKGLITLEGGRIANKIIGEFCKCGYRVQFRLLKAVEFGIPQRRERVIIVGFRNDIVFNYEYPTPVCSEENATPLSAVIDQLAIDEKKYYFSQRAVQGVRNAKKNMKRGLWQDLSKPCLTITAHLAKTSMNSRDPILLVDSDEEIYRRFTPREAARIQSFPDSFLLNDSESKSYKQIGNAVPPVFMWYVAKQLVSSIKAQSNLGEAEIEKYMNEHPGSSFNPIKVKEKKKRYKRLDLANLFNKYKKGEIVNNGLAQNTTDLTERDFTLDVEESRNVLISVVKKGDINQYLDHSANTYSAGKKIPAIVEFDKLCYFMPFIKGKGIKDIYMIKEIRIESDDEGQSDGKSKEFRLEFKIEFLQSLYEEYHMVDLEIWHNFKYIKLKDLSSKLLK